MTTPRIRSLVSLAAALTVTFTLGACASAPSRTAMDGAALTSEPPLAIRFDNEARENVRVYLVSDQRQWLLARVAPGARALLRLPDEALADDGGRLRLAVLTGERITLWAPSEARVAITLAQPAAVFLSQRWTFSPALATGQLTALPLRR